METAAKAFTPNPEADLRAVLKERTEAGATTVKYGRRRSRAGTSRVAGERRWIRDDPDATGRGPQRFCTKRSGGWPRSREARATGRRGALRGESARARSDERDVLGPARKRWRDVLKDGTYASLGPSLSDYAPLWAGIGPPDGDVAGLVENLEASGLVREFGVQATCATTGEQWDAPGNAWPPLVDMLVEGLLGLDHDGASRLARRIGTAGSRR